ncbi:MAG: hypothetical protein J3Q66DRAFT_441776 [Benniella sp.]|nr:MAG: hypothetical protein J3Q66DRAFT_441776 [Benniella sp.]
MKPDLQHCVVQATANLKNPSYFLQDPSLYTFDAYFQSCSDDTSRKAAENEWLQVVIPNFKKSGSPTLVETGTRLEKSWKAEREQRRIDHHDERSERSKRKRAVVLQNALDDHREVLFTHSAQKLPEDLMELLPIRHIKPVPQRSRSASPLTTAASPVAFPHQRLSSSSRASSSSSSSSSSSLQRGLSREANRTLATYDSAVEFFGQAKALQDVVLEKLQEGGVIPAWVRDRPSWTFRMSVASVDYGPSITAWYNNALSDSTLDYRNVDKIALLSGILHLHDQHHALDKSAIAVIRNNSLKEVYSTEDDDMRKAKAAATKWNQWTTSFRSLVFAEKRLAQKEGRDPVAVNTSSLVKDILLSYDQCEEEGILPIFFAGLNMFRKFNNWKISRSEMSWTTSVVVPILEEFMFIQHEIMFTCANSITAAGKQRKMRAGLTAQPCQPDVIGLADGGELEIYYGEIKVAKTSVEEQQADRLRLAIFSKDALDLLERTLESTPPVISFQIVGQQVEFFYAVKIDNTILHCKLSSFAMPVTLDELDLHEDVFFPLFQAHSLIGLAKESLAHRRHVPLATDPFPTMGTPNRRLAMKRAAEPLSGREEAIPGGEIHGSKSS